MRPPVQRDAQSRWLCHLDELPRGASRGFDPDAQGRDTLFVVRGSDRVDAWLNACPHYALAHAVPLAWRKDRYLSADGRHIVCAGHGALFDLHDGRCVRGPCFGKQLQRVPLTLESDGGLWLSDQFSLGDDDA
ncbi:Rieske (2Fe-2S) protein [Paraburkholderia bannensis]|uniref:Rieske (2Fe-2S) protein n=1 Tax=Paraburkholderia bannensis TaxID=765414 RepID=UPI002AC32FF0|nr:Rieske 2Fe-2S domain-containing protein [Paraburkholderia bannensis]